MKAIKALRRLDKSRELISDVVKRFAEATPEQLETLKQADAMIAKATEGLQTLPEKPKAKAPAKKKEKDAAKGKTSKKQAPQPKQPSKKTPSKK